MPSFLNNSSVHEHHMGMEDNYHAYEPYYPTYISAIVTFFNVILLVIGTCGNVLVIFIVASNRRIRSQTNIYLCNLAVSDLTLLIVGVTYDVIILWQPFQPLGGDWFCFIQAFGTETVTGVSVLTITLLAVERLVAFFHRPFELPLPFNYARTVALILAIWVVSATVAAIHASQYTLVLVPFCQNDMEEIVVCSNGSYVTINLTNPEYGRCDIELSNRITYLNEIMSVVGFFLPMMCISIGYGIIMRILYVSFNQSLNDSPLILHPREIAERKRQIGMLFAVVVLFFISHLPLQTQRVLTLYFDKVIDEFVEERNRSLMDFLYALYVISGFLHFFSASMNPYLYFIFSRRFRSCFRGLLYQNCRRCVEFLQAYVSRRPSSPSSTLSRRKLGFKIRLKLLNATPENVRLSFSPKRDSIV